jgi:hypothetical protein
VESTNYCVTTFQAGADRLATLQNNDGGWDWPLDDGDPNNSSPPNTIGPIAMGLAHAYLHTGDSTHFSTLQQAGAFLLSKTAFSPSDGYLAAMLDQIFGGSVYVDHVQANFYGPLAAGTYVRNGTSYDTAGYVNLIRTARASQGIPNLAAWDIGIGLVGAASAGANTAAWIDGVKAEIDELDGNAVYDVIGLAGGVYGLAFVGEDFDPTAGEHAAASNLSDLAEILAGYQIDGGGFTWNSGYLNPGEYNETIQETAYALLALDEFDNTGYSEAIQGASNYMVSVQLSTGGWRNWSGAGENNEVTGEALWGISVSLNPITSNISADPNPTAVSTMVTLNALVEKAKFGCSNITSATYQLYNSSGGLIDSGPMQGNFGTPSVEVSVDLTAPDIPGIYDLCVFGQDSVGNHGPTACTMLVVYDPEGGFVTGGGWIDSPTGAYIPDPTLTGIASFGFVSKYKKGASVPTGNTEFQFKVADLNFHSSSYQWLVVTGSDYAMFKGTGTINGEGNYKFMIWAGDGDPDTFRIKIWEEDEFGVETVIYDNQDDQAIDGGSIVVHTK